ncbi:hypothetical protein CRENBAI_025034 [Crenichthys baileyi]|uniref:Uncharacterized protein n=1 Tax=Crenichthys baileyi TaxID=28760 RepID=A0AAV9RBN5_9TELE
MAPYLCAVSCDNMASSCLKPLAIFGKKSTSPGGTTSDDQGFAPCSKRWLVLLQSGHYYYCSPFFTCFSSGSSFCGERGRSTFCSLTCGASVSYWTKLDFLSCSSFLSGLLMFPSRFMHLFLSSVPVGSWFIWVLQQMVLSTSVKMINSQN